MLGNGTRFEITNCFGSAAILFSCFLVPHFAVVAIRAQKPSRQTQQILNPQELANGKSKDKKGKERSEEIPVCDAKTYSTCHKTTGVVPPTLIHSEDIETPEADLQGSAGLAVVVDEKGTPQKVILVHPFFFPGHMVNLATEMNEKAVKTVGSYRFKPATLNGQPVPVLITISVNLEGTTGR